MGIIMGCDTMHQTLRMSLGVMCDDGFAVSYQAHPNETESLIHHHIFPLQADDDSASDEDDIMTPANFSPIQSNGNQKETITNGFHSGHQNETSNKSDDNQQSNYLSALGNGLNGDGAWTIHGAGPGKELPQRRPIEFPRQIIMKPVTSGHGKYGKDIMEDSLSPMTRLLKEQEKLLPPQMVPSVELYPIKLNYHIVDGSDTSPGTNDKYKGFVLVSRRTKVYDALQDLLKATAPETSSTCKRLWSLRGYRNQNPNRGTAPTKLGDGYEVVDMDSLDGKLISVKKGESTASKTIPDLLVGEWILSHQQHRQKIRKTTNDDDKLRELDILVEIKRANMPWPREKLELEHRVQVGDFVDAQDIAGKWYEAVVKEVSQTTVTVHYLGWASRWNATLRKSNRTNPVIGPVDEGLKQCATKISPRLQAIAPLWTYCRKWREVISKGTLLEVRDSMSKADRPKWYKGVVKKIGGIYGPYKPIEGGADLELLIDIIGLPDEKKEIDNTSNGKRKASLQALLLMNRKQQVLVEVEQEEQNIPADNILLTDTTDSDSLVSVDPLKPKPPFLRWVNLYGEEICEAGTHMKIEANGELAVVTLRYEYEAGRKPVEVMKSWNGMYGQGMVKESLRGTPPAPGAVGMHNLGNSCYLNSIIQCLNHIAPLTQYYLEGEFAKEINRQNPLGSGGHVSTAYATLLKEVWSGNYSALAPRLLKQTVASFAPQFRNSFQHDSQEFCQFLMDGLHEDCNRVTNKPYVEELEGFGMKDEIAAIETWRKHLLRHNSIIVDRCQGMHRSHLTCTSCGRESIKFDVFSTVSLPLITETKEGSNGMQLEECIEKFLEGEQLDEMNAWYCPGCRKHVCALKMIALWSVPDILILHLKRFQFENCRVSNNILRSKIDDTVKFPIENLDLRKYVLGPIDEDAPPVYKLFGVSEHVGSTATSGHYTATVRNCKDGRWYRYNDAHVGETTGDAAVTGGAYLLFYQRAKGNARWGGMEKTMLDKNIDRNGGLETDQDGFVVVKKK
jgi:ubiquitin carboxyl-terminal hydrolase 8